MKKTFVEFLIEADGFGTDTGHDTSGENHIKADIIDLVRSHVKDTNQEVMYSSLRPGKEEEFFWYYFNKLKAKYPIESIRAGREFRNNFNIVFTVPALKAKNGRYLQVFARFPDQETAQRVLAKLTQEFPKKG
jgi:hypothetical protein